MSGKSEDSNSASVFIRRLIAGAGSGAITKTSIAPIERVQILHQIQGMKCQKLGIAPRYEGFFQTVRLVAKEEGFLSLYKGNAANVMRVIPSYAFKFGFNDYYRAFVKRQNFFNQPRPKTDVGKSASSGLSFGEMFLAGSMAGYTQITLTYPLEVMRSRLALDAGMGEGAQYKGVMDCAGRIFREEGLRGLYKGLAPTYASGIPYIATQMTFYTTFQRMLPVDEQGNSPVWAKLCAGASAGVIAQSLSFPGDTLRKRMQNDGIGGKPKQYKGLIDACKQIMRQEGPKAFYHGIKANMISALPGTAIQFVAFDMLKSAMQVDN